MNSNQHAIPSPSNLTVSLCGTYNISPCASRNRRSTDGYKNKVGDDNNRLGICKTSTIIYRLPVCARGTVTQAR